MVGSLVVDVADDVWKRALAERQHAILGLPAKPTTSIRASRVVEEVTAFAFQPLHKFSDGESGWDRHGDVDVLWHDAERVNECA